MPAKAAASTSPETAELPHPGDPTATAWSEISRLFHRLSDLGVDERQEILEELGRENPELAAEVQSFLAADERAPVEDVDQETFDHRYRIVRELGRGGMGIVYLARRADEEYDQLVAVKLIRHGLDSGAIVRRFLRERQILAELSHPNIARLLDGGSTADGCPYLVMEYVAGEPITVYCDRNRLTLRRRLALFLQVCTAVQYAHQRWVVHRDLKASNILVTADGLPMLLDFGTAKLLQADHREPLLSVTRTVERWFTLASASPEQVRGEVVTATTDVYGLGTLLYELLTGSSPHRFRSRAPDEVLRVLCEVEPEPPSRRLDLSREAEALAREDVERIASARRTSPHVLRRALRGDLDAVVVKALQKDPARRYSTVDHLADDLRRHLDRRPIRARRLTPVYRASRVLGRHWRWLSAAAMVTFLVVDLLLWVLDESRNAKRQRQTAEAQRAKAEQVSDFLIEMFDGATAEGSRPPAAIRELLARGVATIRQRFSSHGEVQATLLTSISAIHRKMGDYSHAGALLEGALAEYRAATDADDPTRARIWHEQGLLQMELGRFAAARAHFQNAFESRQAAFGQRHLKTAESLVELAETNRLVADFRSARQLAGEALSRLAEIGAHNNCLYARSLTVLGWLDIQDGRFDLASPRLEEALRIQERYYGADQTAVATTAVTLAMAYQDGGRYRSAIELLQRSLAIYEKRLGDSHLYVAIALMNLAKVETKLGRFDEALAGLGRAYRILERTAGAGGVVFAICVFDIGSVHFYRGELDAAERRFAAAQAVFAKQLEPGHPLALKAGLYLGATARRRGELQLAEERLMGVAESAGSVSGRGNLVRARVLRELALLRLDQNRFVEADRLFATVLSLRQRALPERHPELAESREDLSRLPVRRTTPRPGTDLEARGRLTSWPEAPLR